MKKIPDSVIEQISNEYALEIKLEKNNAHSLEIAVFERTSKDIKYRVPGYSLENISIGWKAPYLRIILGEGGPGKQKTELLPLHVRNVAASCADGILTITYGG